ncbi:hypothetical protein QNO21_08195 [Microbacterium sp. zg-Y818]|uniref:type IV toxin-antitoxin system AbiEi family antitoxin domain-containing protein n=1 Tax=unclassified Microbacterium TaxID=2609290 RepID=UPI00214AD9EA|nr:MULTISPECIES: hypothetical protein [unclassified Microbacterium]MCR2801283.1 hypothetical protein [Microbacterium sp. zg.Y818]WIM21115.1 hypothetical protein QNO21_08195 [Microbacterium sp. zg-Y818]
MPILLAGPQPAPIPLLRTAEVPHPERAVARGELARVRPGVYVPAEAWRDLAPWGRYLARVHAVALGYPDAVFSHESAAALMGLPVFGDPMVVHVLQNPLGRSRLASGIRVHTHRGEREILEIGGLLVTGILDTAVDLARSRHGAIGLSVADAALRADPSLEAAAMREGNEQRISKRGRAVARWALSRANRLAETALESVSRAVVEWLGFPEPALQVSFRTNDGGHDRSDMVWEPASVAGECDGGMKYDGRFGPAQHVIARQGARDARLRRHVRTVAHWGWHDVVPAAPLRDILIGAGLRPKAPEDTAALFSLRRALTAATRETNADGRDRG